MDRFGVAPNTLLWLLGRRFFTPGFKLLKNFLLLFMALLFMPGMLFFQSMTKRRYP